MADLADIANDKAEAGLGAAIAHARHMVATDMPQPSDVCLNCGAATTAGARWCDADCRDDWQRARGRAQ
jgi:hypothetical protein